MSVYFVIDSASDVIPEEINTLGNVRILPLKVIFGQQEYADGVNLSHKEFYEKLGQTKDMPTTCQVPPADFEQAYEELVSQGHEVVVITISSLLSGTYQSSVIAAADYEGKVFPVDSMTATIGERVLLQYGMQLAAQGMGAAAIAEELTKVRDRVRIVATLDTLEFLKRGGRISTATALAGSLLAIKPAIEVKDGIVQMAGTARGNKKANLLLTQLMDNYGGVNYDMPVTFTYAYDRTLLDQFLTQCPQVWEQEDPVPAYSLGCTIGAHVGPGAYGIAFFEK